MAESTKEPLDLDAVFDAEFAEIMRRRVARHDPQGKRAEGPPPEPAAEEGRTKPSVDHQLVGLALSGGGIRSATFNLGLLQALDAWKVLPYVDYISTVSGGGYIASCVTSLHARRSIADFALADCGGESELPAMQHVRTRASYLLSHAFADLLTAPALLIRGALLNVLIAVPYILLLAVLTDAVMSVVQHWVPGVRMLAHWSKDPLTLTTFAPCLGAAIGVVGYFLLSPLLRRLGLWRDDRDRFLRSFALALVAGLMLCAVNLLPLVVAYHEKLPLDTSLATKVAGVVAAVAPLLGGSLAKYVRTVGGKVAIYAVGLIGVFALCWAYVEVTFWVSNAPEKGVDGPLGLWAGERWLMALGVAAIVFVVSRFVIRADMNATSLHQFYRDRLSATFLLSPRAEDDKPAVAPNDEQTLQDLIGAPAPYPLLNTALNMTGSVAPELMGRKAEFFMFSPLYSGSRLTGYCASAELHAVDAKLNLGTAMAISAAAAAPNMGNTTIPPLVLIMTLLNVRLGYWLPNPRRIGELSPGIGNHVGYQYLLREMLGKIDQKSKFVNAADGGHIENLGVYELLRRRCRLIIVGDGEADSALGCGSLATLIRYARVDMGVQIDIDLRDVRPDPTTGLSRKHCALGRIRYPSLEDGSHDSEEGYLLYVKSSLTGDENPYVEHYKRKNESFPHQTTADQFFDEEQFESYRSLGYHITNRLFRRLEVGEDVVGSKDPKQLVDAVIERAKEALLPVPEFEDAFMSLQSDLGGIESDFEKPWCAGFTSEIFPDRPAPSDFKPTPEDRRRLFHLCSRMAQFMENVYMALHLADPNQRQDQFNAGWINLFRRWRNAPTFASAWTSLADCYSPGFRVFCDSLTQPEPRCASLEALES